MSVQSLRVHQPYFLDPLLSPSSLRKITHRDFLPPMLQCISQIHLELDYLPEYTRRDPVMKRRREEVEEGGEEGKEGKEGREGEKESREGGRKAGIRRREERGGREGGEKEEGRVDGRRKGVQSM